MALVLNFVLVIFAACALVDGHAVYNIAHMVNGVEQIDEYLGYGSNALEADVGFEKDGTPVYTYHGFPCDNFRNCYYWAKPDKFIAAIRKRCVPTSDKFNANLALLVFDAKLYWVNRNALYSAGEKFARTWLQPLYNGGNIRMTVMVSIGDFNKGDFVRGLLATLRRENPGIEELIGFDIWGAKTERPERTEQVMRSWGIKPGHAWLSAGLTNAFHMTYMWYLERMVKYRNTHDYFSKVYAWSVDLEKTAKKYLGIDLDGIIMNNPWNMNTAMDALNKRGKNLRLATLDDNPFEKPS